MLKLSKHRIVTRTRAKYGAIYRAYKRKYYLFEVVEMARKLILVGALVLLGEQATTQIFFGVLICVWYLFLTALWKPMVSPLDQFLTYVTSMQLFVTLITGLLLRNAAFEKSTRLGGQYDDLFIDVFLCGATIFVVLCVLMVVYVVGGDMIMKCFESVIRPCIRNCFAKKKNKGVKLENEEEDDEEDDPDMSKIHRMTTKAIVNARNQTPGKQLRRMDTQKIMNFREKKKNDKTVIHPKKVGISVGMSTKDEEPPKFAKSGDSAFATIQRANAVKKRLRKRKKTQKPALPKQPKPPNGDTEKEEASKFQIGDRIKIIKSGNTATVRYIGRIKPLPKGYFLGCELDEAIGKNDGEVRGVRLFQCEANKGAVVRPSTATKISDPILPS